MGGRVARMWASESQIRKPDCLSSLSSSFSFFSTLFEIICQMHMIISTYFLKMQSASLNNGEQYVESPEKIIHYRLTNVMWTWGLHGSTNLQNHYLLICNCICSFTHWVIHKTLHEAVYSVHSKSSLSTSWIPGSILFWNLSSYEQS